MTDPHWLQIVAWAAQIALGVSAIFALIYAAWEVHALRDANRQTARQAKATFLLHLDTRWAALMEARRIIDRLQRSVVARVTTDHPELDEPGRQPVLHEAFAKELKELLLDLDNDASHDYRMVIEYCGFIEIVGLMVRRGYVPLDDVVGALKGPIISFELLFSQHITNRESEQGMPKGLFEHALELCRETKRRYGDT